MPTPAEVAGVAVGVAVCILFIIAFPILAIVCRHLRGRESQLRRWGPANHLLVPPCYCYLTVWVELCPCLEPRLQKFLPKDLSKTGHINKAVSTVESPVPVQSEVTNPLAHDVTDDVTDEDSSSPIMQIVVAPPVRGGAVCGGATSTPSVESDAGASVLDHGHVNMALTDNEETIHHV